MLINRNRMTQGIILQHDTSFDDIGVFDRSPTGITRFLRELVELAGQSDDSYGVPVLELQFGEILTRTVLSTDGPVACLSVAAFLPRMGHDEYRYGSREELPYSMKLPEGSDFFWHADDGRYVVIRNISLDDLPDEPSVMDAILDTSDLAKEWFSLVCEHPLHS